MFLILFNGKVAKMDSDCIFVEAVAVRNNKIFKVGSNDEILKLKTKDCRIIDLNGKTLLPGFIDSHMHLLSYAKSQKMLSLVNCRSLNEIIEISGRKHLQNNIFHNGWFEGRGWNQDKFEDKKIFTRYDLDKISTEVPICFTRACGHVLVVNSKALELTAINKKTLQLIYNRYF